MQYRASPTLIGLFVLSSILLGILAVFFLGADGFSDRSTNFILYFDGDVKGLQIGAPVNLQGVKVGQVEQMSISYHKQSQSFEIPVIVKIDQTKLGFDQKQEGASGRRLLDNMIDQGLRARLNLQSLLTGKMEMELGFYPQTPVRLLKRSDEYPEIPTIPSSMEKLTSALEDLPLQRIINRITQILDRVEQILNSEDLPNLTNNLASTMQRLDQITAHLEQTTPQLTADSLVLLKETQAMIAELRQGLTPLVNEWTGVAADSRRLVQRFDQDLNRTVQGLDRTLASGDAAMVQMQKSAAAVDDLIKQNSPLVNNLSRTLDELAAAARSIRIMAEYLQRHPDALLRGKRQ
ncbi:MAG: MlaD family protein [Chromatiales bacterium]|jgi:paraquat-inducible protein B